MSKKNKIGSWTFGGNIPFIFEKHIERSVPDYLYTHDLIVDLSQFFLFEGSTCIDIGCSTGNLIAKIIKNSSKKNLKFIGIEPELKMVNLCKKNIRSNKLKNVKIVAKSSEDYSFKKADLIISHYTIQFIRPFNRQRVFNKIYKSLSYGGAFLFFEKIRGNDSKFESILSSLLLDFKEKKKFNSKEILNKSKSIRGVLEPLKDKENINFLKKSGFKKIETIRQKINFKGYLCIK